MKIGCDIKAFPSLVECQWRIGREVGKEASGAKELVIDATRALNGKEVICSARNKIGISLARTKLNINCKYLETLY